MTEDTRQCRWCGATFEVGGGPGRPPMYCRRSHRQRAYEARRVADARGLDADEVLLSRDTWIGIRDAIYVAEAAARDAEMDLSAVGSFEGAAEIVDRLVGVIDGLAATSIEPRAVGSDE